MCEGLPHQGRRNAEALGDQSIEDWLERGQQVRMSRLHEHSERAADDETALLCHSSASTLIDEQKICVKQFRNDNCRCLSGIQPEIQLG